MSDEFKAPPDIGVKNVLVWMFAVVLWVICLPVYISIWAWKWATGQSPRVRLWMFTSED
ncbi:hypothetical protein [Bradyrhizobium erythrophlei]|uniref:Uncharacterized protein n=1 Tax=Bradyrhizobium erythrophlei TaxID=1437360 RepID=A0A1M5NKR5_9BRAD|nr:hypothetical protein [Bradyrhizobium erythrophlei]SHG90204.1 hypothetical protein SAMN05443248_3036 [Bradyrhizobium erythrophlei]